MADGAMAGIKPSVRTQGLGGGMEGAGRARRHVPGSMALYGWDDAIFTHISMRVPAADGASQTRTTS